jgi:cytochrome c peroxidase
MLRVAFIGFLAATLVIVAVRGAEPRPIPRDTLPTRLSLDAIPPGLDRHRPVPRDNPLTEARAKLGRRLFFDPILSADGTVACASCHDPAHGFSSGERFGVGIGGQRTPRKVPPLLNRAYGKAFFWDGREATLERQALQPIENAAEMGSTAAAAIKRLQAHADYPALFRAAFADGLTADNLARALASFERVLLTGNSRVDRFRSGEVQVLSEAERHGLWLYESRAGCWRCHPAPNYTDEEFHNTGVSWEVVPADRGRFAVTRKAADRGRFKTPTLRGLTATAPYMHDGSLRTLDDVVEFYDRGGGKNPNRDPFLRPLELEKGERQDLVAFLKALSES